MEVRLGIIDCVGREGDHVLHTRLLQTVYGCPLQHLNLSCPAKRKGSATHASLVYLASISIELLLIRDLHKIDANVIVVRSRVQRSASLGALALSWILAHSIAGIVVRIVCDPMHLQDLF